MNDSDTICYSLSPVSGTQYNVTLLQYYSSLHIVTVLSDKN